MYVTELMVEVDTYIVYHIPLTAISCTSNSAFTWWEASLVKGRYRGRYCWQHIDRVNIHLVYISSKGK